MKFDKENVPSFVFDKKKIEKNNLITKYRYIFSFFPILIDKFNNYWYSDI